MVNSFQDKKTIFLLILVQTVLAVTVGLSALYWTSRDRIAEGIHVGDVSTGGLNKQQAEEKIAKAYMGVFRKESITIKYDQKDEFKIKFIDFDAHLDAKATVAKMYGGKNGKALKELIRGNLIHNHRVIFPVIALNDGKLYEKLNELSRLIDKSPVNADIYLKDGKVVKVAGSDGYRLNKDKALEKIREEIGTHLGMPIKFDTEMETIQPEYTLKDFEGIDEVIASYSTDIISYEQMPSLRLAASAVNKVLLQPADQHRGEPAGEFSFNKYLGVQGGITEQNNEGYNQVVSTVYAAVLLAGIGDDSITRTPHATPVEYIENGLDARVWGDKIDFKFKNTLDYPIVIFCGIKDNKIMVYLAGKKGDEPIKRKIITDIVQTYDPAVVTVENQDLKEGEKRLIDHGKQGITVDVYLVTSNGQIQMDKKLIHTDTYRPVEAIIQIGPNTQWENPSIK